MNAIDLLKEDHKIVDGLFKQVEDTPPSKHAALFKRIKGELDAHTHIEEVIFYPALKKKGDKDAKDIVLEGFEEHHYVKAALAELSGLTPRNERFEPKLKVMMEMVRHHVKEEEGINGMFSEAREFLDDKQLEDLGKRMQAEKLKFVKANNIKPEPRPEPVTFGSIVDQVKEAVSSVFSDGTKTNGRAKPNGRTAAKSNTKTPSRTSGAPKKPQATRAAQSK